MRIPEEFRESEDWYLVSRPVSRQSRLRTLVFKGKTDGFAAEEVGFELVA